MWRLNQKVCGIWLGVMGVAVAVGLVGGCDDPESHAESVVPATEARESSAGAASPPAMEQHSNDSPMRRSRAVIDAIRQAALSGKHVYADGSDIADSVSNLTGRRWRRGEFEKLSLRMTGCYGTCPAYKVKLRGDGRVVWRGDEFVDVRQRRISSVNEGEIQQLREAFIQYDILAISQDDLDEACRQRATCQPRAHLSVTVGGEQYSLKHDHGCTQREADRRSKFKCGHGPIFCRMSRIENTVARTIGVHRWIGSGGTSSSKDEGPIPSNDNNDEVINPFE